MQEIYTSNHEYDEDKIRVFQRAKGLVITRNNAIMSLTNAKLAEIQADPTLLKGIIPGWFQYDEARAMFKDVNAILTA